MQVKNIEITPSSVLAIQSNEQITLIVFAGFTMVIDEPLVKLKALLEEEGESFVLHDNMYVNRRNIAVIADGKIILNSGRVL
jgi:hypothetical protein